MYSLIKSYPVGTEDNRPHGVLYAIPYPINCATPAQQTGTIVVWKRRSKNKQVMTYVGPKAKEMNSGLTWLLREFWAAKGQVYNHPTLDAATGLVEPTGHACIGSSRVFEVDHILEHHPAYATSATDPVLTSYTVKWKRYEDVSFIKLEDMVGCPESISEYWASGPRIQRVP